MKASRMKIAEVIAQKSLEKISTSKLSKEIAAYLLDNNRISDLTSIMRDVAVYYSGMGIVEVNVTSAFPMSSAVRDNIKAKVREIYPDCKKIIINEQIDDKIIAGVRIELPNGLIDLSAKTKLNKFKQLAVIGKGI